MMERFGGRAATGPVVRRRIECLDWGEARVAHSVRRDALVSEEPLEIRIARGAAAEPVAVTMRTPGADIPLAAGFLFTEGLLESPSQVETIRSCSGGADGAAASSGVDVRVRPGTEVDLERGRRLFYAASSCGVCGKASIEAVARSVRGAVHPGPRVPAEVLLSLPATLRRRQRLFARTGGLHAAALFTPDGELLSLHEDVGRHNALDKLIGERWLAGDVPLRDRLVLVSGRVSFEVVQKAARAGVAFLAGVSAPSALAVELADRFGITLVGFLRGRRFNLYCGRARIADLPARTAGRV
jgi:FdhD protein